MVLDLFCNRMHAIRRAQMGEKFKLMKPTQNRLRVYWMTERVSRTQSEREECKKNRIKNYCIPTQMVFLSYFMVYENVHEVGNVWQQWQWIPKSDKNAPIWFAITFNFFFLLSRFAFHFFLLSRFSHDMCVCALCMLLFVATDGAFYCKIIHKA